MNQSAQAPLLFEEFSHWVAEALGELYDTVELQSHPLGRALFSSENDVLRRCQSLRKALLDVIHALEPPAGTPGNSPDRRLFRLMELRYIEGLEPNEVMVQLSLAKSQYYRDQARGLDAAANILWTRYRENQPEPAEPAPLNPGRSRLIQSEVDRLSSTHTVGGIDSIALADDLRAILTPLAEDKGVRLNQFDLSALDGMPLDRVMLRQALLSAFVSLFEISGLRQVALLGSRAETGNSIAILAQPVARTSAPADEFEASRLLVEALGGKIVLQQAQDSLSLQLFWPHSQPRSLLVIDDNNGMIELFRAYLKGSSWQVLGAGDGAAAIETLQKTRPDVILLDILMPNIDGWELLGAIKRDPIYRDIPVIICSVLKQPQIALKLGAAAYLEKPVLQEALFKTLSVWS